MKPQIDDVELAQLETRLRQSVVGHTPPAPGPLVKFIDTMPEIRPAGRFSSGALMRPRIRRAVFALATAATVVFAIGAGTVLVSVRNGQTGQGGDPQAPSLGGWTWQRADGTAVARAYQVVNGFIGVCGSNLDSALCSSPDGLRWTRPADPKIVVVEGDYDFHPNTVVRSGGVYIAIADSYWRSDPSADPTPILPGGDSYTQGTVMWRSPDGLHWTRMDSPAFSGLSPTGLGTFSGGFTVVAASTPEETGWALTSADGLTWTRASRLPVQPGSSAAGPAVLWVGSTAQEPEVWQTTDAVTWTRVQMPSGIRFLYGDPLPGGGYIGLGSPVDGFGFQIVRSDDGLNWRVDAGDLKGVTLGLAVSGGRVFANVSASPLNSTAYPDASKFATNAFAIWQSADGDRTWQPLFDQSGRQMSGMVGSLGGRLAIFAPDMATTASWKITWVGTPGEQATLPASAPPSASGQAPQVTPAPTPQPPLPVSPAAEMSSAASPHLTPPPTPTPPSTPSPPAVAPGATPSGGMSRADAIRTAAGWAGASQSEIDGSDTSVWLGDSTVKDGENRWLWKVTFSSFAGPTSGRVATVYLDYFTGVFVAQMEVVA